MSITDRVLVRGKIRWMRSALDEFMIVRCDAYWVKTRIHQYSMELGSMELPSGD